MHAFVIRPFGAKNGIDFDRVEEELVRPALEDLGFSGGTTIEFIQQGNIRADMFEQLLVADLVIADISIHNANVFYELGIRHAFRNKRTFLIKAKGDDVPFDLKTDRYMAYDKDNPGNACAELVRALQMTWDSETHDSPVYQLLPGLPVTDPEQFIKVPLSFCEEVQRYEKNRAYGNLQMLSAEVDGFAWKLAALRMIGNAQLGLKDLLGAKATWNLVREYNSNDREANILLGTIYQKVGDLIGSDQALSRALENKTISSWQRAEIKALMASNAKIQWIEDWHEQGDSQEIQKAALTSPHLEQSFELYLQGFAEDRNHFYSGLNAVAMATILTELAAVYPDDWEAEFDLEDEAELKLKKLLKLRSDLQASVKMSIESKKIQLARKEEKDHWAEISRADLVLLSSNRPNHVGRAYKNVVADAPDFVKDSARKQIQLFQKLGILQANVKSALANIPEIQVRQQGTDVVPRVIVFTGHRIDAPDRTTPRFPPAAEEKAREMIRNSVLDVKNATSGELLGISGGASGGDILFHEVCEELGISTRMYLVIPKNAYIQASVAEGGADWEKRFELLYNRTSPEIFSESNALPKWLHTKDKYSIWQRSNLWMLHNALYISNENLTLIALWNGDKGDGPGGTEDMVRHARARDATIVHLDALDLIR